MTANATEKQAQIIRTVIIGGALLALCLAALYPNLFGILVDADDSRFHLYRLIGLDHAVQQGELWPRYVPGLAFGYGIPVFNYYAPTSLYPFEILHLAGLDFVSAMLAGMVLYTLAGALGAYLLGRAWGGSALAGFGSAAAFVYAPYILINWLRRGAVAEYLALVLLVWALWALWRVAFNGQRRDFVLAIIFCGLLIATHNISALLGGLVLALYSILLWLVAPDQKRVLVRLVLVGVLTLALSAVIWLPALFEQHYIQIDNALGEQGYQYNFVTLVQIFAAPPTHDLYQMNAPVERSLSWMQIVLALAAAWLAISYRERKDPLRRLMLFALPLLVVLVFLMTEASAFLWEVILLLEYTQFPWRLLGPASVILALLAGSGAGLIVERIKARRWQIFAAVGVLLVLTVSSLPWVTARYWESLPAENIRDAQAFEAETGAIGGALQSEYLPVDVHALPEPGSLAELYEQDDVIPRLQGNADVAVNAETWELLKAELDLNVVRNTTLIFNWLYFPGWRAWLDGEEIELTSVTDAGLIGVEVPAGEHQLTIKFGATPLRRMASWISLAAAVCVAALVTLEPALWSLVEHGDQAHTGTEIDWRFASALALVGVSVFVGRGLTLGIAAPVRRGAFGEGVESAIDIPLQAQFEGQVTLLGVDLPASDVASGDALDLALYWSLTDAELDVDYSSVVEVVDSAGNIVTQNLAFYPANYPTTEWRPAPYYLHEPLAISVPAGTPPGQYALLAGLYNALEVRNLNGFDREGNPLGVRVQVSEIQVMRPETPPTLVDLGISTPINAVLGDLLLLDYAPVSQEAGVGQAFPVMWVWEAADDIGDQLQLQLVWLDEDGTIVAESPSFDPVSGFSTDQWRAGDRWRGGQWVTVPGVLNSGLYDIGVRSAASTDGSPFMLGTMQVSVPERVFTAPQMARESGEAWANGITLLGYDLAQDGDNLSLNLYWQSTAQINDSLTVFVHLLDAGDQIIAQRDTLPADGGRSTTGWAISEVVADSHMFSLADVVPGSYRVRVGWYDAATGERITTVDGRDFTLLGEPVELQ